MSCDMCGKNVADRAEEPYSLCSICTKEYNSFLYGAQPRKMSSTPWSDVMTVLLINVGITTNTLAVAVYGSEEERLKANLKAHKALVSFVDLMGEYKEGS